MSFPDRTDIFEYSGARYQVSVAACDGGAIKLPDGTLLVVDSALETYPPQIGGVRLLEEGDALSPEFRAELVQ